jgi:hypothetical protein
MRFLMAKYPHKIEAIFGGIGGSSDGGHFEVPEGSFLIVASNASEPRYFLVLRHFFWVKKWAISAPFFSG